MVATHPLYHYISLIYVVCVIREIKIKLKGLKKKTILQIEKTSTFSQKRTMQNHNIIHCTIFEPSIVMKFGLYVFLDIEEHVCTTNKSILFFI